MCRGMLRPFVCEGLGCYGEVSMSSVRVASNGAYARPVPSGRCGKLNNSEETPCVGRSVVS